MKGKKFVVLMVLIVAVGILLDQSTKLLMAEILGYNDGIPRTIEVFGSWLTFSFIINTGASFGSMEGQSVLFFIITLLGVPGLIVFLYFNRNKSLTGNIGIAMAISGAIGNAIDRAFLGNGFFNGGVRDFISVEGFAIFNVADSFLCVGVGLIIIAMLFVDKDAIFRKKEETK